MAPRCFRRGRFKACLTNEIKLSETPWSIKVIDCPSDGHVTVTFIIALKHWWSTGFAFLREIGLYSLIEWREKKFLPFSALPKMQSGYRYCNKSRMTPSRVILYFISSEWNTDPGDSCDCLISIASFLVVWKLFRPKVIIKKSIFVQ